ncbi:MAG: nucleotide sugar dehydrogenase [Ilumatobacteraceae bacterium]
MSVLFPRLTDRTAKVAVIGQGYVGLPVAMRASQVGFPTLGFDVDEPRIAALQSGRSHVGDVPDTELAAALAAGYRASSDPADLAGFDGAVVSVPTPLRDGAPDRSALESAGALLAPHVRRGCCVILESTTYPGTTTELLGPILAAGSGLQPGADFHLGYSPERIDPGNARWNLVNTPKVVSGVDAASLTVVDAFFSALVATTVPVGNCAEAETTKLLENTFRHVNIALVNELAMVAHELDIDVWNVIAAADTKPFGFMRFTPGPGVGGHCLPIDPTYLSWRVKQDLGRPFRFVELANEVNDRMPEHVAERVVRLLNEHGRAAKGAKVLMLGLAYKAGTADFRESPSIPVLKALRGWGIDVDVCDPYVDGERLPTGVGELVPFDELALSSADLVLVMVDHPDFDPARVAATARLVFDAKGLLRGHEFKGVRL